MSKQPSTNVNNPELLIWAAYQLEAFEEWVHQEAIFLKAFELAPLRLSWATRPDIPDKHIIAGAFQKTVRENPDFFVKNNQGLDVADGRQISPTCTGSLLKVKNGAKRTRVFLEVYMAGDWCKQGAMARTVSRIPELKSLRNSRDGKRTKA